ncbi:MAG: hypothetical protein DRJ38_01005 [Thermoprotei archaeon]|nr:MAG: hypothetical protein DRJ38_01005 [Thermoprotei archaeon]
MTFETILAVLKVLDEFKMIDLYILSKKLKISVEEAESILGLLLSHGYIRRKEVSISCSNCPLKSSCLVFGRGMVSVYIITKKGRSLLEKLSKS